MRLERGAQRAIRAVVGASLITGMAAGCGDAASTGHGSPTTATAAATPVSTASARPRATTTGSPKSRPAAAADPATPARTASSTPARAVVFTLSCPTHGSTSAPGCGSWDAGASSGQAPGFASAQQSSPNLLGVNQDPWTGGQGPQVLRVSSFQDWSVTATDTDPSNAPGEVLTYPDASFNYYELDSAASGYTIPPAQYDLNNITSLTSDFTESMPQLADLNAEAAYDMWLNNWQTEVMVWVDTSPAKDRNLADDGMTDVGTYTYDGQNFALWRSGSGITGFYVFLLDHNETSGTVDLKAMLETMVSLGYIPADSPLTQIPFGWEISDTGGQPVTFSLSQFDVNLTN
jgi:Glycosyl hydrolase family 12